MVSPMVLHVWAIVLHVRGSRQQRSGVQEIGIPLDRRSTRDIISLLVAIGRLNKPMFPYQSQVIIGTRSCCMLPIECATTVSSGLHSLQIIVGKLVKAIQDLFQTGPAKSKL